MVSPSSALCRAFSANGSPGRLAKPRFAARRHGSHGTSDAPPTRAVVGRARTNATSDALASSSDAGGPDGEAPRRPGRAARARARRERAARLASAAADDDRERALPSKVFLGGVTPDADEASIADAFGGPDVARDVFVHRGRGFAFVAFADETSAANALAFPPRNSAHLFAEVRAAAAADAAPLSVTATKVSETATKVSVTATKVSETATKAPRAVSFGDARRATFAVQCQESHADRLEAYLRSRLRAEVLGIAAPNEPPRKGRRVTERVVLCRARTSEGFDDAEIIRRVRADPALAMHRDFFPRVYDLRDSAVFASLAAASRAVVDRAASDAEAAGDESGDSRAREVKTRLETFPPSVARSPELAAAAAVRPGARTWFTPRRARATRVATVVSLRGDVTIVSHGGRERDAATDRDDTVDETTLHASRAYLKLAECALRDASLRDALARGEGVRAVDVGAAPGGWTQFLARKGCRVVAIDPADVPNLPSGCRHLKDTAQNAWGSLRHETNWCPFDVYVSDAVLHDADAQQALLRGAVENGLLRDGAVVVLTFKSAPGRGAGEGYRRAAFARARNLGDEFCDGDWTLTHLFANRSRERTFVGTLRL